MQDKLHEIRVFENFQEELFETGHVIVTTEVVEKSLNYFGNAHGGYLFTLNLMEFSLGNGNLNQTSTRIPVD